MSNNKNTKILMIVDDKIVRGSIADYLSKQEYKISHADSLTDAIELFHSFSPDLVLYDIRLDGLINFEPLQTIFSVSHSQTVIILADKEDSEEIVEAMNLGVSDYFIKPVVDLELLELAIRTNVKRASIVEENHRYRRKLEHTNQELENALKVFETDQQAGRHVQVSMLPKTPQDIGPYHFNHRVIPSLYLSGDSVYYKAISKHELLFYIADVAGHGSSSAFVTILLRFRIEQMRRDYIQGRFADEFSPAGILASLNKDLIDAGLDKHITLFVGVLNDKEDSLCYSVAGHHPLPIIYSKDEAKFIALKKSSFPIGLLGEAEYFEESVPFANNASLTLFSDGILEILALMSMIEKEEFLLSTIVNNKGNFKAIISSLGLDAIGNVPDDIAVMSVSMK